jgi:hypothetical protein
MRYLFNSKKEVVYMHSFKDTRLVDMKFELISTNLLHKILLLNFPTLVPQHKKYVCDDVK